MTADSPIPFRPKRPPKRLAVVTCHFNPCGYEITRQNFLRFTAALDLQEVPWYAIELAFDDRPFALPERPEILRRRTTHVLWHKERLLNVLIQHVPPRYDRIAWVDADVVFTNPRWSGHAERLLDTVPVVQLYEIAMHLDRNGDPVAFNPGVAMWARRGHPQVKRQGTAHTGFAWAARRSLLERHGLLDRAIAGGADFPIVRSMFGWFDGPAFAKFVQTRQVSITWAQNIHADVKGQVGFVPGTVQHLWHGDKANRQYVERHQMFIDHGYDPDRDLRIGPDGLWEWTDANPALEAAIRQYFLGRQEDG